MCGSKSSGFCAHSGSGTALLREHYDVVDRGDDNNILLSFGDPNDTMLTVPVIVTSKYLKIMI